MTNAQAALLAAATYWPHSEDPSYALETATAWAKWLDCLDRERSADAAPMFDHTPWSTP